MAANVNSDDVFAQNEIVNTENKQIFKKKVNFSETNYLNVRLKKGENSKTLRIRLLPFSTDGGTPFHMIHMHNLKVDKKLSESGFKSYVCLAKTKDIDEKLGDKCPLCDLHDKANQLLRESGNEIDKKRYSDLEFQTRCKNVWVVRCIDREHEDEGVKFWKFNTSSKKDGVYDKLFNLFKERMLETGEEKYNIFDIDNGKDLIITLTRGNDDKTSLTIMDASRDSPLSKDPVLIEKWVSDEKKWSDVYVAKPYEYLEIVAVGDVPFFDKNDKKWVSEQSILEKKKELEKIEQEVEQNSINKFSSFDSEDLGEPLDLTETNNELGF